MWDLAESYFSDHETRDKYLKENWEPFAVSDGRIWFRKHAIDTPQNYESIKGPFPNTVYCESPFQFGDID